MTTIAHISDLHFGAESSDVVLGLIADLGALQPTLVAVSGDLTQRARPGEFMAARAFLDRLPFPKIVVPGNHDIPLFDVLSRFARPLARFRRYINEDVDPFFINNEVAVLGVNTARSNTWKEGRVSDTQIADLRRRFEPLPSSILKVLVTHHPFLPPSGSDPSATVGRASEALRAAEASGVDVMLAGHLHLGYTGDVRTHYVGIKRAIVVAQAGTATSHRIRNESNSYNLIRLSSEQLTFSLRAWDGRAFQGAMVTEYAKAENGWTRSGQ